jgi:hypothetical protein
MQILLKGLNFIKENMVIMESSSIINTKLLDIMVDASSGGVGYCLKPLQPVGLEWRYNGGRGSEG